MKNTALAIFAHPDDAEFLCAGTLSLLKNTGWEIHIATLAPGDKGTAEYNREEISFIRKGEASNAAKIIGATYHCLEMEDVYIFYDRASINKTTSLIRNIKPSLVFTASPSCYMVDHEITSQIVQTACFSTGIMNMEVAEQPYEPVPYLYYSDAMDGKDKFGTPIQSSVMVDISSEIETKEKMLACHASQRNWLMAHHHMDEYILSMKRFSAQQGTEINVAYAEGFRQHLGHGYPQRNILKEILGNLVVSNKI
jgi:LmbE family N-acetylglucosaminyl deacetylase